MKNLNDDTRYTKSFGETQPEKKVGWMPVVFLIAALILLGYFILGS